MAKIQILEFFIAVISRFKHLLRGQVGTILVHYLPHLSTWIVDVFWNGRNLFYHRNHQSAFWCFLALHSLTSWTLEISTEHSCHRIYSKYIYIYTHILQFVGVNCFPSTELHDYQDNDSPILGLTWSLGIFTASHSGSTYTATRGIVQGSPGLVKFNPFGFSQPRFPQRLGSRRTSGLQSDHNERRLWLHWMGYIWIRFSVFFFEASHISLVFCHFAIYHLLKAIVGYIKQKAHLLF